MKRFHVAGALLVALAFLPATAAVPEGQAAPQVMILGTFHFQGSEADAVSVTMGNVLSERRQAEIEDVVSRLAAFKPTKIMIEATPDAQDHIDSIYEKYLAGEHELSANEWQQLGLRLAKRLEHDKVLAVDHQQPMDFERMMKAGERAGQVDVLGWFNSAIGKVERDLQQAQAAEKSILDALRFHNGPWALEGNSLYLGLAELGSNDDPAGAEVIAGWYERNLKIYANILRQLEDSERALVIYGSGHLALLSDFFAEHPDVELISALEYLGEPDSE